MSGLFLRKVGRGPRHVCTNGHGDFRSSRRLFYHILGVDCYRSGTRQVLETDAGTAWKPSNRPALMNGTFSPYCSVMRVFNMKFFRVALSTRLFFTNSNSTTCR